jgi:hypothetical protein
MLHRNKVLILVVILLSFLFIAISVTANPEQHFAYMPLILNNHIHTSDDDLDGVLALILSSGNRLTNRGVRSAIFAIVFFLGKITVSLSNAFSKRVKILLKQD